MEDRKPGAGYEKSAPPLPYPPRHLCKWQGGRPIPASIRRARRLDSITSHPLLIKPRPAPRKLTRFLILAAEIALRFPRPSQRRRKGVRVAALRSVA